MKFELKNETFTSKNCIWVSHLSWIMNFFQVPVYSLCWLVDAQIYHIYIMVTMGYDLASIIIIWVNHHAKVLSLTIKELIQLFPLPHCVMAKFCEQLNPLILPHFIKQFMVYPIVTWIQNKEMILYDVPHRCVALFAESKGISNQLIGAEWPIYVSYLDHHWHR